MSMLNQGAKLSLESIRKKIFGFVEAEATRREFWRKAVLASLHGCSDAYDAVKYADIVVEADIERDERVRDVDYIALALDMGFSLKPAMGLEEIEERQALLEAERERLELQKLSLAEIEALCEFSQEEDLNEASSD